MRLRALAALLRRSAYAAFLLLASSFLLFALLELSPALRARVHPRFVRYYDARERWSPDPVLIYVPRVPDFERRSETTGDLDPVKYGVPAALVRFDASYAGGFRRNGAGPPYDVVVVGDSLVDIGESDDDTLSERLRRRCGVAAANLGRPGYGPQQYVEILRRHAPGSGARLAVFAFFDGNDVTDLRRYRAWRAGDGGGRLDFSQKGFLARYGIVLRDAGAALESSVRHARYALQARWRAARGEVHPDVALVPLGDERVAMGFGHWPAGQAAEALLRSRDWQDLRGILEEFRDVARAQGMETLVLFIPAKFEIYGALAGPESGARFRARRGRALPFADASRDALAALARGAGVRFVDLVPEFRARAGRGDLLYYPFDTHWNPAGRQAAAEVLAQDMRCTSPSSSS